MRYQIKAVKSGGAVVSLSLDARDDRDANEQAESQGYSVLSVRPARALALPQLFGSARFPLVLFTQELLALLRSGISLLEALETLRGYHWPGNVRELRNVIERAVVICEGEQIEQRHLPFHITGQETSPTADAVMIPIGMPLEEVERRVILSTLARTEYNKTRTAETLRISLKTLHNKLKAYREAGLIKEDG